MGRDYTPAEYSQSIARRHRGIGNHPHFFEKDPALYEKHPALMELLDGCLGDGETAKLLDKVGDDELQGLEHAVRVLRESGSIPYWLYGTDPEYYGTVKLMVRGQA